MKLSQGNRLLFIGDSVTDVGRERPVAQGTLFNRLGRGYLSEWAKNSFADTAAKNQFFARFGRLVTPEKFRSLRTWPGSPAEMLVLADKL